MGILFRIFKYCVLILDKFLSKKIIFQIFIESALNDVLSIDKCTVMKIKVAPFLCTVHMSCL